MTLFQHQSGWSEDRHADADFPDRTSTYDLNAAKDVAELGMFDRVEALKF